MVKSTLGTGRFDTRKFDGKVFYSYTWHGTKALATKRAKELRLHGYNVRIVKARSGGQDGYLLYTKGGK